MRYEFKCDPSMREFFLRVLRKLGQVKTEISLGENQWTSVPLIGSHVVLLDGTVAFEVDSVIPSIDKTRIGDFSLSAAQSKLRDLLLVADSVGQPVAINEIISDDPDFWQLYDKQGRDMAGFAIRIGLIKELVTNPFVSGDAKTANQVMENMIETMLAHSEFGALDTEPRSVLGGILSFLFDVVPSELNATNKQEE